jgi:hypothetical protein
MKKFILGTPAPDKGEVEDRSIANGGPVMLSEPSDPEGLAEDSECEGKEYMDRPSVYIHNAPEGMTDIPDEGHAHVKYKVVGKHERTDRDGKKSSSIEIEIHHFTPKTRSGESEEPKKGKKSAQEEADEAFDNYEKDAKG